MEKALSEQTLDAQTLARISAETLAHYDQRAEAFKEGTSNHDVSQNINALLIRIEGNAPFRILDLGCGPGRDLTTFIKLGHLPTGLDGSAAFAAMARNDAHCEVWQQDFLKLDLPPQTFDGVYANASLFHVPSQELPRVLRELFATLKPGGVLFASNPRGDDQEGWNRDRYGAYYTWPTWQALLVTAGFIELEHYYRPEGMPREQQPWLASVWRKPADLLNGSAN